MRFSAIDAFCGAGGLSLGLQTAGFDIKIGFDVDPVCVRTLSQNPSHISHPVIEADVRSMLNGRLMDIVGVGKGEIDLLAGGPPCQGFSIQRTTGEEHDERNTLVNDYGDLIKEIFPRFFLLENVPGIGGARGRKILTAFLSRMGEIGYVIHEKVLDAQHYGVPQRRKRYLIVGERLSKNGRVYFKWPSPISAPPLSVRDAIGHLPSPPSDGSEHPAIPNHRADRLSKLNKARLEALAEGQGRTSLPEHLLADCHKISADVAGHRNVYGRMAWDQVAPTITARFDSFTRGKFGHPEETRTISLREGAILQAFPESYRFVGNKVEVARQIGNAVPPKLATSVGKEIIRALRLRARE
jgi:DNA (cytosine-5)-methyltransferase 1